MFQITSENVKRLFKIKLKTQFEKILNVSGLIEKKKTMNGFLISLVR